MKKTTKVLIHLFPRNKCSLWLYAYVHVKIYPFLSPCMPGEQTIIWKTNNLWVIEEIVICDYTEGQLETSLKFLNPLWNVWFPRMSHLVSLFQSPCSCEHKLEAILTPLLERFCLFSIILKNLPSFMQDSR